MSRSVSAISSCRSSIVLSRSTSTFLPARSVSAQPPERLVERLERLVAAAQSEQRSPSVVAGVFRDGETVWRTALGRADVEKDEAASVDHAYRIGSITKTFTAACILQLYRISGT